MPPAARGELDGDADRLPLRHVGGLEPDDQERLGSIQTGRPAGLVRVEDAAVGRPEVRLHEPANGLCADLPRREHDAGRGPEGRAALDPHPRLADHAEDALAADHQPVRARAGSRAREPPALPPSARGEHAHRLDEVVDVRAIGRVVPARPGRDPTPQRREAEALREVPQREPVGAQCGLQRRAVDARLDARRERHRVDLQHPIKAVHGDRARRRRPPVGSHPTRRTTRRRTVRRSHRSSRTSRAPPRARPRSADGRRHRSGSGTGD